MAHGGKRNGAGRKHGSLAARTREIATQAAEEGLTPLEYMLTILRDGSQDQQARFQAAKEAAPYIHARLASMDMKADVALTTQEDRMKALMNGAKLNGHTNGHDAPL